MIEEIISNLIENFFNSWPEILIFGTVQGAVYALLALGFSLVYGVGGVLNLAHGAFYLMAGYIIFWVLPYIGYPFGIILALIVVVLIGALAYLLLIKPLQKTHIGVIIATFALAFFFEQFIKVFGDAKFHTLPALISGSIDFLGVTFPTQLVLTIVGSLIIVSLITIFINKSKLGKSIRAVSQDREAAMLMGINANRILMYTIMISALLAGLAAFLYVPADYIAPHLGWSILINSFAVVVLGGMGSLPGSIIGSFIIGYVTNFTSFIIDPLLGGTVSALIPIIVILVVLVIRPQGILGKKEID